ncbi:MAG: AMP-binding protein [Deltaproteobacteria bacterium]|nr:AMP-binding protein [Deltaproteobacteria bacterium]
MSTNKDTKTLLECMLNWEKQGKDRRVFTQPMGGGDENLKYYTYGEAMEEARRLASYIKSLELPPKSCITLLSKNTAWWMITDIAIWMAGHVSVPIFPTFTADTVEHIIKHSESKLLFVGKLDPVWEQMKEGIPSDITIVATPLAPENDYLQWDDIISKHEPLQEVDSPDPATLATLIYTSGSTGQPKGVMISHKAMRQSAQYISEYLDTGITDRALSYLPLAHSFERAFIEAHLFYCGGQVFFAEALETFVKDLQRAAPTMFLSVPRLWLKFQLGVFQKMPPEKLARLLKIPILKGIVKKKVLTGLGLQHVRFAGSGSAPIPKEVIEWYRSLGLDLLEGYGMSENFAYSHSNRPGQAKAGTVGVPQTGVECKISEEGEILVKSPGDMMGYYKNEEATKEMFTEDGWLKTGDRGSVDEMGRLTITGRVKELFKTSKGKYIAPAPIENMINNHPQVELSCVCGSGQPQPHALVMLSEDARAGKNGDKAALEAALKAHLDEINSELAGYEKLEFLAVVKDEWLTENGFLTPTLKVKRGVIEDTYTPMAPAWYEAKKPVIWQE